MNKNGLIILHMGWWPLVSLEWFCSWSLSQSVQHFCNLPLSRCTSNITWPCCWEIVPGNHFGPFPKLRAITCWPPSRTRALACRLWWAFWTACLWSTFFAKSGLRRSSLIRIRCPRKRSQGWTPVVVCGVVGRRWASSRVDVQLKVCCYPAVIACLKVHTKHSTAPLYVGCYGEHRLYVIPLTSLSL